MSDTILATLISTAASADDPAFIAAGVPRFGGVDPLGLRAINFNLMDRVLPGLNNVARHVKPFVVVTWAWRRALRCAQLLGSERIELDILRDFVDRIEVLFVWSQLLQNGEADLPGRDVLAPMLTRNAMTFGGPAWEAQRRSRRDSTALSAAINYGPGLSTLGWLRAHPKEAGVSIPSADAQPALDALDNQLGDALDHDAFNRFGSVVVERDDVSAWGSAWDMNLLSDAESRAMRIMLFGSAAPVERQLAGQLLLGASRHLASVQPNQLRAAMAGEQSDFMPGAELLATRNAWRRVQVRQLFRLALEAAFYWMLHEFQSASYSIDALAGEFLDQASQPGPDETTADWIERLSDSNSGPTALTAQIESVLALRNHDELPRMIASGLAFCLASPEEDSDGQPLDRLPISRAQREAKARAALPVKQFLQHVFESWVLAQHTYWSVGRSLADARAGGKVLLRLKAILDEGGWTLTPGASPGNPPRPTPDRLQTAVSLASECRFFEEDVAGAS